MSEQTIAEKSLEIRQETEEFANTRGRVANVLDDINTTKANKSDVAQSIIDQNQNLQNHINDQTNPHHVDKSQIGLGNVDNTSDLSKPISTATQNALTALSDSFTTSLGNKVDKTTTTITAPDATFKYAYIFDENNNVRRMLAGDLGKNVANSSLTSVPGAGLTMGANWAINTSGFYYSITGLNDVSNDSTFNTLLTQNPAGRVAQSNGKGVFMSLPTLLTDAEKTTWKTNMNGGWSTSTMSVGLISPPIINKNLNSNTWVALKGANLNLPPTSFSVEIMDETGSTMIATVPNAQVQLYQNGIDLTFYYNFHNLPNGNYKVRLWNGIAYYVTSLAIQVSDNLQAVDLGLLSWNVKTYNDASSSVIYGDAALARITPDAAVKPLDEGSEFIASVKSSTLFDSGKDFYLRFNVSYNDTGTTNADAFIGLITSSTPNSLSNNNLINISFDSFIIHYTGMNAWFNGTILQSAGTAVLTTLNVSIIRRGTYYSMIVETPSNGTKFFSFTNTTEALALCLLGTNSQRPYQFSVAIQEAYILN